jgi:putative glutamine amidotransferase
LPDVVGHEEHTGGTLQEYQVEAGSQLEGLIGTQLITGKSYHHQAVKDVGENLKIVSKNADGTVEAIEATDRPWVIGVQWHPERTLEDAPTQKIFKNFIDAARQFAEGTTNQTQ